MTPEQALQVIETFRRSVLTVMLDKGSTALTGVDHDNLREAVGIVKAQVAELIELRTPKPDRVSIDKASTSNIG